MNENDILELDDELSNSLFDNSYEDAMIEAAQESAYEDAMIEAAQESAYEDAMIEAAQESAYEDAMLDAAIMDNLYSYGSSQDSKEDVFYLFDKKYKYKTASKIQNENKDDVSLVILKKYEKVSASGKTAYFSYKVSDINSLRDKIIINELTCNGADTEHWVSWKYDDINVEVSHYFQTEENLRSVLFYPIEYNYAKILQLNKYNPNNFHFQKLDFLKTDKDVSCGDKFSVCKISSANNSFQMFYIKDFAVNIIDLMKCISKYSSINEYIVVEFLKLAINHILKISKDLISMDLKKLSITSIVYFTDENINNRIKYIKKEILLDSNSEFNILKNEFEQLKKINY